MSQNVKHIYVSDKKSPQLTNQPLKIFFLKRDAKRAGISDKIQNRKSLDHIKVA